MSEAPELSADEKAAVARFKSHDEGPRVKVWCVNWPHPGARHHAVVHIVRGELFDRGAFFDTWEQAMVHADKLASVIRAAGRRRTLMDGRWADSDGLASPFPGGVA